MISADTGYDFELAIYDVARDQPQATATITLNGWPAWPPKINGKVHHHQPRVNTLTYSPDGIYLAVARSDNKTEVYDSRFLTRGPVYDLKHSDPPAGFDGDGLYGVYKAEWLQDPSDRLQLVTSGADGSFSLAEVRVTCLTLDTSQAVYCCGMSTVCSPGPSRNLPIMLAGSVWVTH